MSFLRRCILAALLLAGCSAQAQTTPSPLPAHAVRTINPTDTDFTDLAFLRQEIGAARVVMLGEPTHGVGTATEAKIRLVRYLKEQLGFTTIAFESGFFALDQAERDLQAGTPAAEAIGNSVYPVWTETQEFQALLPLLGKGGLHVAGFDSQVGWGSDDMLEELEAFLKPEKGADDVAYDYLDECVNSMGEMSMFPPDHQLSLFNLQLSKVRKLLEKVTAGPEPKRRERAAFWLQNMRSLQALAHDYAINEPASKDSTTFKAKDSNPRDAQMADNLLWYVRQHPRERIICWGALGHLEGQVSNLENEELQAYRPMGQAVKDALGAEKVYVMGLLAGSGTHGFGYWGKHQLVPTPASGTLEAELLAQGSEYSFVSLKHDALGRRLTTSALQFQPVAGPWYQAVDGFLFIKAVAPPHPAQDLVAEEQEVSAPVAATPVRGVQQNPATRPVAKATMLLRGTVLDWKSKQPVPYATVASPARSVGTVTDEQGHFQIRVHAGEMLQVSCIGYEPATLTAHSGATLAVQLQPAAYTLAPVRVSAQSQDPRRIMKKVIEALPRNYDLGEQTAQVYEHRQISNFDTVRLDAELVVHMLVPAGFRQYMTFLKRQPYPEARTQEAHFLIRPAATTRFNWASALGHGMTKEKLDVIRLSPLFQTKNLRRYIFRLDTLLHTAHETTYVVAFWAKKANKRTTGTTLQSGFQGRLFVQASDFAVTRYEALWQGDTTWYNAAAHKYLGQKNISARIFSALYTDWRNAHTATYTKWADGRYRLSTSVGSARAIGRDFKTGPFHYQSETAFYFRPLPPEATVPAQTKGSLGEMAQGLLLPEHLEFWQNYQRPSAASSAPALQATTP